MLSPYRVFNVVIYSIFTQFRFRMGSVGQQSLLFKYDYLK